MMNKEELTTLPVQGTSHCSCLEHCFLFRILGRSNVQTRSFNKGHCTNLFCRLYFVQSCVGESALDPPLLTCSTVVKEAETRSGAREEPCTVWGLAMRMVLKFKFSRGIWSQVRLALVTRDLSCSVLCRFRRSRVVRVALCPSHGARSRSLPLVTRLRPLSKQQENALADSNCSTPCLTAKC